jgi:putative transposase
VDSQGLLLAVWVHEANIHDSRGVVPLVVSGLDPQVGSGLKLKVIYGDGGYLGAWAQQVAQAYGCRVEVVKRTDKEFKVQPKRWVVERTFAWLGRYRRMSKDYELLAEVSTAMIYAAMVHLMLKRLDSLQTL